MNEQFKVGEIAIMQYCFDIENEGQECTIIRPLATRNTTRAGVVDCYVVMSSTGRGACQPYQLRKKQPPSSAKTIMRAAILKAKQPQEVEA